MTAAVTKAGSTVDLFTPDGFTAAQMFAHAIEADPSSADKQIAALEGWSFAGVSGQYTVRAADHALLQPEFQAKLTGSGTTWTPQLVNAVDPATIAPPLPAQPAGPRPADDDGFRTPRAGPGRDHPAPRRPDARRADLAGRWRDHRERRVTLDVAPGEFLAFIGPNGAGKTSLFNLISGLLRPTPARSSSTAHDVTAMATHRRAGCGLGRTFQTSSVFGPHDGPRERRAGRAGGDRRLVPVLAPWAGSATQAKSRADMALERRRPAGRAGALAGALSHGEKRKLELAVLLVGEPRVMLLDEPMAGVAAEEVPELTELIRSLLRAEGRTVLMVEHHMDVVLGLADRLAVMHHGDAARPRTPRRRSWPTPRCRRPTWGRRCDAAPARSPAYACRLGGSPILHGVSFTSPRPA